MCKPKILAEPLSLAVGGKWAIALVADVVAVFAVLQFYGLRQPRKGSERASAAEF